MSTASIKGLTFSGLQGDAYGGSTYKSAATVMAEIDAAKNNFGCTAVRLQIQQQLLVGQDGLQYDGTYKATVDSVVQHALDAGLIVIINCQTLNKASRSGLYYPNQSNSATNAFWQHMSVGWNGNANVIFDVFNEPDCNPGINPGGNWSVWQSSFNALIGYMRNTLGITNTLWADADDYAKTFSGCPGLTDPNGNLVYSFHHPSSAAGGDSAGWDADFGNWASSHQVVNGEFAQNETFNWNNPYVIQHYLDYLSSHGIGQTLWTVFGDNYFSNASRQPYGWWGHMIANRWANTGWSTYVFRSSVKWSANYKIAGPKISWGDMYQGWSASQNSMLVSLAGFNDLTARMAEGSQWRIHVAFKTIHANGSSVTALLSLHREVNEPVTRPSTMTIDVAQRAGCVSGCSYNIDVPSGYLASFRNGTYKGIGYGPGPSQDVAYQGHHDEFPFIVLEVHA